MCIRDRRIFDHDVDISYSTREPAYIRDNMATLGVTTMSVSYTHLVNTLLALLDEGITEYLPVQILYLAVYLLQSLVDRHGSYP